jgi:hypothetical protein
MLATLKREAFYLVLLRISDSKWMRAREISRTDQLQSADPIVGKPLYECCINTGVVLRCHDIGNGWWFKTSSGAWYTIRVLNGNEIPSIARSEGLELRNRISTDLFCWT